MLDLSVFALRTVSRLAVNISLNEAQKNGACSAVLMWLHVELGHALVMPVL